MEDPDGWTDGAWWENFAAASGDAIPNLGGMSVPVVTREFSRRMMSITAAPVTKPLVSVKQLNSLGYMVVFDDGGSYLYSRHTGETNVLREENGNFMLDVWVPPNEGFGGQ